MTNDQLIVRARSPLRPTAGAGVDVDGMVIPPRDDCDRPLLPASHPPSSPLASATAAPSSARDEDEGDRGVAAMSPPLLKRRTFSRDREARRQTMMRRWTNGGDRVAGTGSAIDGGAGALETIPSLREVDNNWEGSRSGSGGGIDADASTGRRALFSTPTRERPFLPVQNADIQNQGRRGRAVSSDIVLNISNDCLPRYNNDFASTIANIDSNIAEEVCVMNSQGHNGQGGSPYSFSTPERPTTRPSFSRDRANTCPHRPQRHFISQQNQGEMDEESGIQRDDQSNLQDIEDSPPEVSDENHLDVAFNSSTPARRTNESSANSTTLHHYTNNTTLHHSPDRRTYSASSALRTPQTRPFATPSSSARRLVSSARPPLSSSQSAPNATPTDAAIPHSPQTTAGGPSANRASSSSDVRIAVSAATRQRPQNCIYRINPGVMKFLMILSLYVLLAYTWNADLRFRYKSAEINYGLSEYWAGGIGSPDRVGSSVDKLGRNVPGKLFNDDGDDGGVAKLIKGLGGDDAMDASSASGDLASGDSPPFDGEAEAASSLRSGIISANGKRRQPSLSHARSLSNGSHPAYGAYNRRRAAVVRNHGRDATRRWTFSRVVWCLVWAAFALPVVEAALREVRRQLNFRLWNVRRLRGLRAAPNGGGRATNVHDL